MDLFSNFDLTKAISYASLFVFGLIAVTLHECAHGYAAFLLGDTTAKDAGRLTLNPIKHIDIVGLACMIIMHIGWAKPVPINPSNFENRKQGIRIVSIAGPAANAAICIFCVIALKIAILLDNRILFLIFIQGLMLNVGFAIFNMLPFPPLDGSKLLASFLPPKIEMYFYKYQNWLSLLFLILYFLNLFDNLISAPIEYITLWLLRLVM